MTTPARTILDLAAGLQARPLERLLDQAEATRLTHVVALDALARAHPGHQGSHKLRTALPRHTPGTTRTKSDLEEPTRDAFERDRHRDATLARAGYRTLRFTYDQVTAQPRTVAATLRTVLGR